MPALLTTDVETTELFECHVDEVIGAVPGGHVFAIGDGDAAGCFDLGHDGLCRCLIGTLAGRGSAEIVHDDQRSLGGEQQRVLAPDPAAGAGHDGYATFQCLHELGPLRRRCDDSAVLTPASYL